MGGPGLPTAHLPVGLEVEGQVVVQEGVDVHEVDPEAPEDGGHEAAHGDVHFVLEDRLLQLGPHGDGLLLLLFLILLAVDDDPPYYDPRDDRQNQHCWGRAGGRNGVYFKDGYCSLHCKCRLLSTQ